MGAINATLKSLPCSNNQHIAMGGEGSMLHAIKSLEYNNSLKRKNNPFKKEWGVGGAWYQDYTKYTNTEPHNSHYDKDARAKVRRKARLERKRDQSGLVAVGVLVIVLTALAVYSLLNS